MPASIIEDNDEVNRWFEEERKYSYMIEQYREKYGKETTPAFWSKQRQRRGYERRENRFDDLIPWRVKMEHSYLTPAINLRREARRRAGLEIGKDPEYQERAAAELDSWLEFLRSNDSVVHYDPDTEQGWEYRKRRPGVDLDIIREPDERLRRRPKASVPND